MKGFGEINRRKSEGFRYKKVKGVDTKNRPNSENNEGVNTKNGVKNGVDTKKRASVQKKRSRDKKKGADTKKETMQTSRQLPGERARPLLATKID